MTDTLRGIEKLIGNLGVNYTSQVHSFIRGFQFLLRNSTGKWMIFHQSERLDEGLVKESLVWGKLYNPELGYFSDKDDLYYKLSFGTPTFDITDDKDVLDSSEDAILGPCSLQRGMNLLTRNRDLIIYRYHLKSPLIDNLTPKPEFFSDANCDCHLALLEPIASEEYDINRHLFLGIDRLDSNSLFEGMKNNLLRSIF